MIAMEPIGQSTPDIRDVKSVEDVRLRGRENIYRNLDKAINFVAPLADPEGLYELGKNRVEKATVEIVKEVTKSVEDSVDAFILQPFEKTKKFAESKAEVLLKWSLGLGLTGLGKVEGALQLVSKGVDEVRDWRASKAEKKADKIEERSRMAREKAVSHRNTVNETRENTKKMTAIREMAAALKA